MNDPFTAALVILVVLILVLFIIIRNKTDRKEMEETMNQDYHRTGKEQRAEKI